MNRVVIQKPSSIKMSWIPWVSVLVRRRFKILWVSVMNRVGFQKPSRTMLDLGALNMNIR